MLTFIKSLLGLNTKPTQTEDVNLVEPVPEPEQNRVAQDSIEIVLKVKHFDLDDINQWGSTRDCPLARAVGETVADPFRQVDIRFVSFSDGTSYLITPEPYTYELYLSDLRQIRRFRNKDPERVIRTVTLERQ